MDRISSLLPISNVDSKILILGSMPGARSLEVKQYYAFPQNQFWKILYQIFDKDFSFDYQARKQLLKDHNVALWDVIESCIRKGSSDIEIKTEKDNDILDFINKHSEIKIIFCNGQKSHQNIIQILGKNFRIPIVLLPSTSPQHTIKFEAKFEKWKRIKKHL